MCHPSVRTMARELLPQREIAPINWHHHFVHCVCVSHAYQILRLYLAKLLKRCEGRFYCCSRCKMKDRKVNLENNVIVVKLFNEFFDFRNF